MKVYLLVVIGCLFIDNVLASNGSHAQNTTHVDTVVRMHIEACDSAVLDAGCTDYSCYHWSNGVTGSQTITVYASGVYQVQVGYDHDNDGICDFTYTKEFIVTISPGPILDLGPDQQICNGAIVQLDAGSGHAAYLWNDGHTGQTHEVNQSGMYSVQVTNSSGCTATDEVDITTEPPIILSLSSTESCGNDGTATISAITGGVSPFTYLWSNGQTTQTAIDLTAGTYTVSVTDAHGCASNNSVQVVINAYCSSVPCDNAYTTMNTYIYAAANDNATAYTFTFYDLDGNVVGSLTQPSNQLWYYQVPGLLFNHEYTYSVTVEYEAASGTEFGPESDPCSITFLEPQSSVPCDNEYATMNTYAYAYSPSYAASGTHFNNYIFTFYDLDGNEVTSISQSSNQLWFYQVPDLLFNHEYTWTVAIEYVTPTGTEVGPESDPCAITFLEPASSIPCNQEYSSLNTYAYAQSPSFAPSGTHFVNYVFTFYDASGAVVEVVSQTSNQLWFNSVSGLLSDNQYTWTVAIEYVTPTGTAISPASEPCTINFE